jgi:hypothetical protein
MAWSISKTIDNRKRVVCLATNASGASGTATVTWADLANLFSDGSTAPAGATGSSAPQQASMTDRNAIKTDVVIKHIQWTCNGDIALTWQGATTDDLVWECQSTSGDMDFTALGSLPWLDSTGVDATDCLELGTATGAHSILIEFGTNVTRA